jgi:hypothetical protein
LKTFRQCVLNMIVTDWTGPLTAMISSLLFAAWARPFGVCSRLLLLGSALSRLCLAFFSKIDLL